MQRAVFLDRDGVINEVLSHRVRFVNGPRDLFLLEGVPEAIRQFNDAGWKVFIVTNQGGVGLGFLSEAALNDIHEVLIGKLKEYGARVDDIAYCPHRPGAGCPCRKPEAGMLLDLAGRHDILLEDSYMAGDREPDILAGKNAGTQTVFINRKANKALGADHQFDTLLAFSNWLTG
ncbi:D-glycero-alpha-D-manno-heptose-1,7-bisphosphate 7-phosphatase [Salinicoccus hispanicus]|uniref:D,D-heptose 1,7-bisphosphate phosphatase n=1 Tax=Salinicoccus hispanicus TaxID=157225 RepID=A0A6N8U112_9STAP|nr:HAD family hydrolase [Salinicoccus hispanicus]MXQ50626.1 HAD-IIIA family hydrolase [Salinicoccus hispanicus]